MAVLSKQDFLQVQSYNCKIIHPWHQNCLIGNLITSKSTLQGSSIFFGALYLVSYNFFKTIFSFKLQSLRENTSLCAA